MEHSTNFIHEENRFLQVKYDIVARFYDILDYPWERHYRRWRPVLLRDVRQSVLEAGVGTGRNLKYYHPNVELTAIDICIAMLNRAMKKEKLLPVILVSFMKMPPLWNRFHLIILTG